MIYAIKLEDGSALVFNIHYDYGHHGSRDEPPEPAGWWIEEAFHVAPDGNIYTNLCHLIEALNNDEYFEAIRKKIEELLEAAPRPEV